MLQTGMTVALGVLAVLAQARTPKEICDDIARQNGGRPVPGCVELIESGQKKDEGKEEKKAPPKLEIPKVDFKGLTPGKDDCWAYLEAFEVIGSFTNYAFWMTDKHGVVAERKTLHGIYLQDASQNAGDARAAVLASAGAGEACSELAQPAEALAKSYQSQFDKLTAALKVCAMDKSATKWKDCPGAAGEALKFDDEARASGGPLERYLQLVDGGKQQCISEDGRALLEQMRRSPCERPSNWATEGSRCAHSRYGLATGRIGQLSKVRGNLSKVSSGSVLGAAAQTAFEMVGDAQSELSKLVGNPAEDNRILFDNTYRVFAAQKVLEAGKHFCSRYE